MSQGTTACASVLVVLGGNADVMWNEGNSLFNKLAEVPAKVVSRSLGQNGFFAGPHGDGVAPRLLFGC